MDRIDYKSDLRSNSILTKEELNFYENLRNIWSELNQLLRNPPQNLKYRDLESATKLFANMAEAKHLMDQMHDYVNGSKSIPIVASVQRYMRSTIWFRPVWLPSLLPTFLFGDLSPMARLLNRLADILTETRVNFCKAYGLTVDPNSGEITYEEIRPEINVQDQYDRYQMAKDVIPSDSSPDYMSHIKEYMSLGLNKRVSFE